MVEPEAAERFLSAPLLGEVDPESRRALLEALVEERARAGVGPAGAGASRTTTCRS